MFELLGRVYARIASIGARSNQLNSGTERVTTLSGDAQTVEKTLVQGNAMSKRVIDSKNLKHYVQHVFDCAYWDVPSKTPTKEALKSCNCGYTEFETDKFLADTLCFKILERVKKTCGQCNSGAQKYHASEGFYHKSGEEIDDYCDATPLWTWLMELGYLKVKEEK